MSTEAPPTPIRIEAINLNDSVELALTETGKSIWKAHLKSKGHPDQQKEPEKITLQIWETMAIFGSSLGVGKPVPFSAEMPHKSRIGTSINRLKRYSDSDIPERAEPQLGHKVESDMYCDDDRMLRVIVGTSPVSLTLRMHGGVDSYSRWVGTLELDSGPARRDVRIDIGGTGRRGSVFHEAISSLLRESVGIRSSSQTRSIRGWSYESYDDQNWGQTTFGLANATYATAERGVDTQAAVQDFIATVERLQGTNNFLSPNTILTSHLTEDGEMAPF